MTTDLEILACQISNDWLCARRDHANTLPSQMEVRLNKLERLTRGNPLRCTCIAGRDTNKRQHAVQCGAYPYP